MTRYIIMALLVALGEPVFSQETTSGPDISFDNLINLRDTVEYFEKGHATYCFVNTDDEPLIIKSVKVSTGSMMANWPNNPIMPGDEGEIELFYICCRPGPWSHSVSVLSNATNAPIQSLRYQVIRWNKKPE